MINLHERLSEFSYGFGVTWETQKLLGSVGFRTTPFLPSLLHEAELGFDVGFKDNGRIFILQFKLGQEMQKFRRAYPGQPIPNLDRPFWRFPIDEQGHQFERLVEFENEGAEVYYVAPRFSHWAIYEKAFQAGEILENSLIISPSAIRNGILAQGSNIGTHRIVYDNLRIHVCSEPVELQSIQPQEIAHRTRVEISERPIKLDGQIERIYSREITESGPGKLADTRQEAIFKRAKRKIDAMAAIIGLEAWSQGAQLIFVTDVES
ncbi:MAG: hypothetical protein ACFB6R_16030 [Alphaproteobacteria bacterium]